MGRFPKQTLNKNIFKPIREARIIKFVEDCGIVRAVREFNLRRWEVNEIVSRAIQNHQDVIVAQ